MTELTWMTAAQLSEKFRTKETNPVEVLDAVIAQIERTEDNINAFVTLTLELAKEQAQDAAKRLSSGEDLPPLYGVPITVKDLVETAGIRTTYGCTAYANFVPDEDSVSWARLKSQGVILIGKTTTPEFGLLGVTESKLTGTTNNPWNTKCTAGGSSGGAAAAVVSGVAPLAWGSDGGGSIRVPSSLCGVVGVKPTLGRIPTAQSTDGDSTDGPIARTVLDAALMLDATVGHHPSDRFSLPATGEHYAEAVRKAPSDMRGVRVAALPDLGQRVLHPETRRVFESSLELMRDAGATVEIVEISLPDTTEYFNHLNGPEYAAYVDEYLAGGATEEEIWPLILDFADKGRQATGMEVSRAFRDQKTEIYDAFCNAINSFDVLVSPTTPVPAFEHGGDYGPSIPVDGVDTPPLGAFLHSMTEPPAHAGFPAISINGGFTNSGLPVGLQFMSRLHDDLGAVVAAARWENVFAATHAPRVPSIAGM